MVRIRHRRRQRPLIRFGEQDREIVVAWFVVLLAVDAGLSCLSIQQYAARDCSTLLTMQRDLHRPLAVTEDWEDRPCSSGPCGYTLSTDEHDDESDGAAQHTDDPAADSGKDQLPSAPIENTNKEQRELLCS